MLRVYHVIVFVGHLQCSCRGTDPDTAYPSSWNVLDLLSRDFYVNMDTEASFDFETCPLDGALLELQEVETSSINGERLGLSLSSWMLMYRTDDDEQVLSVLMQVDEDEAGNPLEFREKQQLGIEKRYVLLVGC